MFVSISLFTLSLMGCCCSSPDTLSVDPSLRFTAMNPPVVYNFYFDRPTEENLMAVKEIISSSLPEEPSVVCPVCSNKHKKKKKKDEKGMR